jgi:hypothetical protein
LGAKKNYNDLEPEGMGQIRQRETYSFLSQEIEKLAGRCLSIGLKEVGIYCPSNTVTVVKA